MEKTHGDQGFMWGIGCIALYDKKRDKMLAFGGIPLVGQKSLALWEEDLGSWKRLSLSLNVAFASAVYDELRETVVVFGGIKESELSNDTTIYSDNSVWQPIESKIKPPARAHASMVYARKGKNTILFGGATRDGRFLKILNDTWSFDGNEWIQISPDVSPSARAGACAVYEPNLEEIILFGGTDGARFMNDMWAWTGTTWREIPVKNAPSARAYAGMVYDETNQQVILFGGQTANGISLDTWVWNGDEWNLLPVDATPPIESASYPVLVYHPQKRQVMLFATIVPKSDNPDDDRQLSRSEIWVLEQF